MPPDSTSEPLGRRERKKAKTRRLIQQQAMRLFQSQGYTETTVEQIAEASEVSKSTFFRYFPTKEDVLLQDDFDQFFVAALRAQPKDLTPLDAVRFAAREVFSMAGDELTEATLREQLVREIPEVRARIMDEFVRTIHIIAVAVAERSGRAPDDPEVNAFAGAVIGVILAIWIRVNQTGGTLTELPERLDASIAFLATGLAL